MSNHPFLFTEPYLEQLEHWPKTGRHVLAQFDDHSVVVYQAYRASIGLYAHEHQYFGGDFSFNRMSWIKPNFLWMMYRCGWGTKPDQEVTLAIRLKRSAFDQLLRQAVHSSFIPELYSNTDHWQEAVAKSEVRLQWDPDHGPRGEKLERRAIQLGLRGQTLANFGRDWLLGICDISDFVIDQRKHTDPTQLANLLTPRERVYPISDAQVASRLIDQP